MCVVLFWLYVSLFIHRQVWEASILWLWERARRLWMPGNNHNFTFNNIFYVVYAFVWILQVSHLAHDSSQLLSAESEHAKYSNTWLIDS